MSIRATSMFHACAAAREIVPGPVPFEVLKVHDGDSFSGEAAIWPASGSPS